MWKLLICLLVQIYQFKDVIAKDSCRSRIGLEGKDLKYRAKICNMAEDTATTYMTLSKFTKKKSGRSQEVYISGYYIKDGSDQQTGRLNFDHYMLLRIKNLVKKYKQCFELKQPVNLKKCPISGVDFDVKSQKHIKLYITENDKQTMELTNIVISPLLSRKRRIPATNPPFIPKDCFKPTIKCHGFQRVTVPPRLQALTVKDSTYVSVIVKRNSTSPGKSQNRPSTPANTPSKKSVVQPNSSFNAKRIVVQYDNVLVAARKRRNVVWINMGVYKDGGSKHHFPESLNILEESLDALS